MRLRDPTLATWSWGSERLYPELGAGQGAELLATPAQGELLQAELGGWRQGPRGSGATGTAVLTRFSRFSWVSVASFASRLISRALDGCFLVLSPSSVCSGLCPAIQAALSDLLCVTLPDRIRLIPRVLKGVLKGSCT